MQYKTINSIPISQRTLGFLITKKKKISTIKNSEENSQTSLSTEIDDIKKKKTHNKKLVLLHTQIRCFTEIETCFRHREEHNNILQATVGNTITHARQKTTVSHEGTIKLYSI